MNLLIVDDEIIAVQGILDSVDWEFLSFKHIFTAYNMNQAIEIIKQSPIHIMLCDIEMPGGSGIDLLTWTYRNNYDIKCLIITSHDNFNYAQQAIRLKCVDYILKPILGEAMTTLLSNTKKLLEQEFSDLNMIKYGEHYIDAIRSSDISMQSADDILKKAEQFIRSSLSEVLTVEDIAMRVSLCAEDLEYLFKQKNRITVAEYIVEQRLFLARELLEKGDISINLVSAKVGYSNYLHFTKLFQEKYGILPREYQKKFRR